MPKLDEKQDRSYHRWTKEERQALMDVVDTMKSEFGRVGGPGGIPKGVFWSQVPGRLGLLVSASSAEMCYRTLTEDSSWARKRRARLEEEDAVAERAEAQQAPTTGDLATDEIRELRGEVRQMTRLMAQLLEVWTGKPDGAGTPKESARSARTPEQNGH